MIVVSDLDALLKSEWLKIHQVQDRETVDFLTVSIDLGEAESIVLAQEIEADFLLIDERKGRQIAQKLGVPITGTVGVLLQPKADRVIAKVKPLLDKLIQHGFRVHPELYRKVLSLVDE